MRILSVRDYRNNLADSFTRAYNGERVLIRRKNQLYALVSIGEEDLSVTPELQKRIDEAEKACREGRCVTCKTAEDIETFLDSL
ncbi:MAG: hypothetical protein MJZ00_07425 [Paludibacteraceae bacterium]|nr:hypothetical protein [Paludibacteraceae bacterium]